MTPAPYRDRILRVPTGSVLVTVGAVGSGKSRWAERNLDPDQVVALDDFRRLVAGSDTAWDRHLVDEAFSLLLVTLEARARRAVTTLVDGAFLQPERRARLLEVCARHDRPAVALCFRVPEALATLRSRQRNRVLPSRLLEGQVAALDDFLLTGASEGWSRIVLFDAAEPDLLPVLRYERPAARPYAGPFDVISDVHGCLPELDRLLDRCGWAPPGADGARRHPEGRLAVFVGDYADRGPDSPGVFRRVMAMHAAGTALGVPGNHCLKLLRWLRGRPVELSHGLEETVRQFGAQADAQALQARVRAFLEALPRVLVLADGELVVFHAALPRENVGRDDEATHAQTAFGVVRGTDENGFPVRDQRWTEGWKDGEGEPFAVYGHTPVPEPLRMHHTLDIDGGCCFGGYLTAFRWPERQLVTEPAARPYYPSPKVTWRGAPGAR